MAFRSVLVLLLTCSVTFTAAQQCTPYIPLCNIDSTGGSGGPKGRHLCNVAGTVHNPKPTGSTCNAISFNDCRDSCLSNPQCKSFAFDASSGNTCTYYSKTLAAQKFRKTPAAANVQYFNRDCFAYTACATPAPATFRLQIPAGSGSGFDQDYGSMSHSANSDYVLFSSSNASADTVFTLDNYREIVSSQNGVLQYGTPSPAELAYFYFNTLEYNAENPQSNTAACRLFETQSSAYGLECIASFGRDLTFVDDQGFMGIGDSAQAIKGDGGTPLAFQAVATA